MSFSNKTFLITGGTGSFGQAYVDFLIKKTKAKKIIIFSRDENKQFLMQQNFKDKRLRFFLGDVRDRERLCLAFKKVDYVLHAAALKQVPTAEYNPSECLKTNVFGSENVISAAISENVKKVIMVSTDKACNPINLYGASKLCAEKLFINANRIRFDKPLFSVVRYGNVISSRGSVIPYFKDLLKLGVKKLPLTNIEMTRFFITLNEAVMLVSKCLEQMIGGEIFIPKMNSIYIRDLIKIIDSKASYKIIGTRPGEKVHELLFSYNEHKNAYETKDKFIIYPSFFQKQKIIGKKTKILEYSSGIKEFINKKKIEKKLRSFS